MCCFDIHMCFHMIIQQTYKPARILTKHFLFSFVDSPEVAPSDNLLNTSAIAILCHLSSMIHRQHKITTKLSDSAFFSFVTLMVQFL